MRYGTVQNFLTEPVRNNLIFCGPLIRNSEQKPQFSPANFFEKLSTERYRAFVTQVTEPLLTEYHKPKFEIIIGTPVLTNRHFKDIVAQ